MQLDLIPPAPWSFGPGARLLPQRALASAPALLADIAALGQISPPRQMKTPGGHQMTAALTNCGALGWVSSEAGYAYTATDPLTGVGWPAMPARWLELAQAAAAEAGYPGFEPDVCLINRYPVGSKLGLHQDKDERSHDHPVVSISLGLPATFVFGGLKRTDPLTAFTLSHGDMAVWGGASRLYHHGVRTLAKGVHPATGDVRYALTFRKAG